MPLRLTKRDEQILRAVARFGVVRTPDLVRLLFGGVRAGTAARRLRRLFDASLLEVRSRSRSESNVYTLGPEGRRWVREQGLLHARVPRGNADHHLSLVGVWTNLAAHCHRGDVRLTRFVPDWELRARDPQAVLVPDALVELQTSAGRIQFALEIDLGNERAGEWRRKIERYGASATPSSALGLVVLYTGGPRRGGILEGVTGGWAGWKLVAPLTNVVSLLERLIATASPYALPLPQGQTEPGK